MDLRARMAAVTDLTPSEPRFAVDCMLGRLAKWLKILGYDTVYHRKVEDAELVAIARSEGRVLLTRDRRLTHRRSAPPFLLISSDRALDQLREVAGACALRLEEARFLSRCLPCNAPTDEIQRDEAQAAVPPYVFQTQSRFRRCSRCGRVYWGGTHRDRMMDRLREIFPKGGGQQ